MTEDLPGIDLGCGIPDIVEAVPMDGDQLGSVLEAQVRAVGDY